MTPAYTLSAVSAGPVAGAPAALLGPERLMGMAGALLVVIAVVLVLAWVAQRLGAVRNGMGRSIRVREVLSVGARDRLLLLDCEGERLLIGASPAGLVRLHAFGSVTATETEGEGNMAIGDALPAGGFAALIGRCIGRPSATAARQSSRIGGEPS